MELAHVQVRLIGCRNMPWAYVKLFTFWVQRCREYLLLYKTQNSRPNPGCTAWKKKQVLKNKDNLHFWGRNCPRLWGLSRFMQTVSVYRPAPLLQIQWILWAFELTIYFLFKHVSCDFKFMFTKSEFDTIIQTLFWVIGSTYRKGEIF